MNLLKNSIESLFCRNLSILLQIKKSCFLLLLNFPTSVVIFRRNWQQCYNLAERKSRTKLLTCQNFLIHLGILLRILGKTLGYIYYLIVLFALVNSIVLPCPQSASFVVSGCCCCISAMGFIFPGLLPSIIARRIVKHAK